MGEKGQPNFTVRTIFLFVKDEYITFSLSCNLRTVLPLSSTYRHERERSV